MKRPKGKNTRLRRFIRDVTTHTPFTKMVVLLVVLWLLFSAGVYLACNARLPSVAPSVDAAPRW